MNRRSLSLLCLVGITAALVVTCAHEPIAPPGTPPVSLAIVAGDQQSAVVGTELTAALAASALDVSGRPIRGQLINFRVTAGGGSVFAGSSITNDSGIARERWTLGTSTADSQRLEARAVDNNSGAPLVFGVFKATALPGPATAISKAGGDNQTGSPGLPLTDSLSVRVADRYNNPVPGDTVRWSTTAGTVFPAVSLTGGTGLAKAAWSVGTVIDGYTTTATRAGLAPVAFSATATLTGSTVTKTSGDGQNGFVNSALPESLVVTLTASNGQPLEGGLVSWSASGGNGLVSPSSSRTTSTGQGKALWTLGASPGGKAISASVAGLPTLTFNATAVGLLSKTAGDGQTGTVGVALADSLIVTLAGPNGQPAEGKWVRWLTTAGNGVVSPDSSLTTSLGQAKAQWILGASAGTRTATAIFGALPSVAFTATATTGPPATPSPMLTITSPANHTVARVGVHLAATCTGGSLGCTVTARLLPADTVIATSHGSLDTTLALPGGELVVALCAEDDEHATWPSCSGRTVYVEGSSHLVEVASVPAGPILDADANGLLFLSDTATGLNATFCAIRRCAVATTTLSLLNRTTSLEQQVTPQPVSSAKLALSGTVLWQDNAGPPHWHEWRNGSSADLGFISGPTVRGSYALWATSGSVPDGTSHLIRRDLTTDADITIAHYGTGEGLTPSGDVWYQAIKREDGTDLGTYQIVKYSGGTRTEMTADAAHNHVSVATDGVNAVYLRWLGGLTGPVTESKVVLIEPSGETTVYDGFTNAPAIRNGWVFYYRQTGVAPDQLWSRSSGGTQQQVTFFSTASNAEAYGDNGEVVFLNGNRRYRTGPPYAAPPTDIMRARGQRVFFDNGKFHVALGRSLFEVQ